MEIFEFLKEILKQLFDEYSEKELIEARNYSLRDFVPVIKDKMRKFKIKYYQEKKGKVINKMNNNDYSIDDYNQKFIDKSIEDFDINNIVIIVKKPSEILDNDDIIFSNRTSKLKNRKNIIKISMIIIILLLLIGIIILVFYLLNVFN